MDRLAGRFIDHDIHAIEPQGDFLKREVLLRVTEQLVEVRHIVLEIRQCHMKLTQSRLDLRKLPLQFLNVLARLRFGFEEGLQAAVSRSPSVQPAST
jgi:hypothetical protein